MRFFMQHILDCAIADLSKKKPWIDKYDFFVYIFGVVDLHSNSAELTW